MSKARTIDEHLATFSAAHPHLSPEDLASIKALAVAVRTDLTLQMTFCRDFARDPYDEDHD